MAGQLHTEGRQYILEVAFSEQQSVPTNFYVGLCTNTSLVENASLSTLTELTDTDYARQIVPSTAIGWISAGTGTNDRKVTSATVNFAVVTSGITWTKADMWFLATTIDDSGKLLMSDVLNSGSGWTLTEGQTLGFEIELIFPG